MDEADRSDANATRWEVQVRKGVLELAVLATLARGRLYGLELIRQLESAAGLGVPESTLYPLLNRLRTDGLLDAEWVEAEAGHPRKYYELTATGRKRLAEMTRFWREFTGSLDAVLIPGAGERTR